MNCFKPICAYCFCVILCFFLSLFLEKVGESDKLKLNPFTLTIGCGIGATLLCAPKFFDLDFVKATGHWNIVVLQCELYASANWIYSHFTLLMKSLMREGRAAAQQLLLCLSTCVWLLPRCNH